MVTLTTAETIPLLPWQSTHLSKKFLGQFLGILGPGRGVDISQGTVGVLDHAMAEGTHPQLDQSTVVEDLPHGTSRTVGKGHNGERE